MTWKVSKENLNQYGNPEDWPQFRKKTLTKARRVVGPFEVETREGVITCEDGWLAIDSGGWPYPIAADEFERIYEQEI